MKQEDFKYGSEKTKPQREYKPFVPGPNRGLTKFIKEYSSPYDAEKDNYKIKAFDKDLVVHKHNKLYTLHLYWSKKDPIAISAYVNHYTKPGDLIFDPFAGSGTTGCASLINGRNVILVDVSPSACFLAYHYNLLVDPNEVTIALTGFLDDQKKKTIDSLYATKCDRCGGDAITEFIVWSDCYQCPNCAKVVSLFDCKELSVAFSDGSTKKKRLCPYCFEKSNGKPHSKFIVSTRSLKFEAQPVACKYICLMGCKPKGNIRFHNDENKKARQYFEKYDLPGTYSTQRKDIKVWFPKRRMMDVPKEREVWGVKWRSGSANFKEVADLFTNRNLRALAELRNYRKKASYIVSPLLFLTWILHKCSNLMGYGKDGVGRIGVGTYYVPPIRMEVRPSKYIEQAKTQIFSHFREKSTYERKAEFCLSVEPNADACKRMPPCCVDYVFTDPPYLNVEVQYGEMNFLWDAWLDFPNSIKTEITLNPIHNHSWDEAEHLLRLSMFEIYRVLKPGRWASICYHDTSEANWSMLQRAILDAGFEIHTVTCLDPRSKSRKAITAEKIVKSDLVLNCRKPRPGDQQSEGSGEEIGQVSKRVLEILIETLSTTGGQTRDKLWDIVLKRLLTRGQMAEHRFEDILNEVAAKSESGRWFLKEEYESLSESDLRNEEDAGAALEHFCRLRCTGVPVAIAAQMALDSSFNSYTDEVAIERHIKRAILKDTEARNFKLGGRMKGCEFYDCLFVYLTRHLKGRSAGKIPRRNLAEFLEEYLVRFRDGDKWLYRPPSDAEAESLRKSRLSGLGRRIRQFVAYLNGEGDFPKERIPDAKTLVAWLKHCANFGLAEAGVVLYEKGGLLGQLDRLSEDERYDVEDYYAQCRRNAVRKGVEPDTDESDAGESEEGDEV